MIADFMPCPQRVYYNYLQVRPDKWKVIVASIEYDNIRFFLGLPHYLFIIHPRINNNSALYQRLVLLPFLYGALLLPEIFITSEPLHLLFHEIAVRHWVPYGYHAVSFFFQY